MSVDDDAPAQPRFNFQKPQPPTLCVNMFGVYVTTQGIRITMIERFDDNDVIVRGAFMLDLKSAEMLKAALPTAQDALVKLAEASRGDATNN